MKKLLILVLSFHFTITFSQEKVNPIIKNFGGIYEILEATVLPDPDIAYKIVIDVYGGGIEDKAQIDGSLDNVARMLNLHAIGGVEPEKLKVVLAVHGRSTYSLLTDEEFNALFGMDNPNTPLIKELKAAGVRITVCGQSLVGRGLKPNQLQPEVEVATSMLTTVTSHQMAGYNLLRF